jgi:hypothetical protein
VILTPYGFLCEPGEVGAGNMMVVADLRPAHPAKEALGLIGASAVEAVCLSMVDPVHRVAAMKLS